jgi:hypothetical protein
LRGTQLASLTAREPFPAILVGFLDGGLQPHFDKPQDVFVDDPKRKPPSIATELKQLLERSLRGKVTLRQGARERIVTLAAAGIEQLVNQFAKGDRHARRDLIVLAEKLGVDLAAGQGDALEQALANALPASDQALLKDYVRRHRAARDDQDDSVEPDWAGSNPNDSDSPE